MANINRAANYDALALGNEDVGIFYSADDPSSGGETAPIGSLLLQKPSSGEGVLWEKIDSGDTDWAKVGNSWGVELLDDKKIILGTGSDGEIYSSSDDIYIKNVTQDKDIIFQINDGGASGTEVMRIDGSETKIQLANGTGINEFSTDGTMVGNSDDAVPTEQATKTYIDGKIVTGATFLGEIRDVDNNTKIQVEESADENKIRFDTAGIERMIITDTGTIGIGENTPLGLFHVKSGESNASPYTGATEIIVESSGSGGISIMTGNTNQGTLAFSDSGNTNAGFIAYNHNDKKIYLGTKEVGGAIEIWTGNGSTTMLLTSSGNVGIGTTVPTTIASWASGHHVLNLYSGSLASRMTVQGQGAVSDWVDLSGGSNDKWLTFQVGSGIGVFSSVNDNGSTNINNILSMDLGNGNVGIGVSDPDTKLEVFYAGNQLKLSYDATDNCTFGVDTDGNLTITPSGTKVILAGDLDAQGNNIFFTQQTVTYNSGTTTVDWNSGQKASLTFGAGNITTLAFTNPPGPCNLTLKIIQDSNGSRTIGTWDTDIKWNGGSIPTLSTGPNTIDLFDFYFDGTNYYEKSRSLNLS